MNWYSDQTSIGCLEDNNLILRAILQAVRVVIFLVVVNQVVLCFSLV